MAFQRPPHVDKKRKAKKKKARTEVSSSSESDSDVAPRKSRKSESVEDVPRDVGEDVGAAKKEKSGKSKSPPTPADEDVSMADSTPTSISPDPQPQPAPASAPPTKKPKSSKPSTSGTPSSAPAKKPQSQTQEDFGAIYLRRIAAELADDLDKVREAPDFKANSVPMLVHALRQGESMFSVEERRRVVGAAGN